MLTIDGCGPGPGDALLAAAALARLENPALGEFCSPPPIDDAVATSSGSRDDDVDDAVEDTKEPIVVVALSPVQELPDYIPFWALNPK